MERRHFLKFAFSFAAGTVVMAASAKFAEAAPIAPLPHAPSDLSHEPRAALATQDDLDQTHVEKVRWHYRRHHWRRHYWRRRRWGWRHRHWHRRRHW